METSHLIALGDSGWRIWRESVLRGAGFPASDVLRLSNTDLARAADNANTGAADRTEFDRAYSVVTGQISQTMRHFAADGRFREAVAWQNRQMLPRCLDLVAAGEPRNAQGRKHELAVASYVQRYCVKNDTIGYFGPVGWARWTDGDSPLTVRPGPELLSRRKVYFELWAVDALADVLAQERELHPWLRPRPVTANWVQGRLAALPGRAAVVLTDAEAALLALVDGNHTVREIAGKLSAAGHTRLGTVEAAWRSLAALVDRGLIQLDLQGPVEAAPELSLRRKLAEVDDPAVRGRALAPIDELIAARDAVAAAAGDAERVAAAVEMLNQTFERLTGNAALRRAGRAYAGRGLIYEDTVRDVTVELGRPVLAALAPPLGLVLDSARWLTARVAEVYRRLFAELYDQYVARTGEKTVPFATFVGLTTPYLSYRPRGTHTGVDAVVEDFRNRWERILSIPRTRSGVRRHEVEASAIADRVAVEFPAAAPEWATAIHHSPDIMIAAESAAAIERGEFCFVLGEIHLATNTVESRALVEQHPDPDRLLVAAETDHGQRRICLVPSKEWEFVTSRTSPPSALWSPRYSYLSLRADAGGAPGQALSAAAMSVHRSTDGIKVRHRGHDRDYDLLELLGEALSATVANAFSPLPGGPHQPRVTIDRLVVTREKWAFPVEALAWTAEKNEQERYRRARAWRAEHDLPEHVFYRLPTEQKPMYLDFTSLILLNLFAKGVRSSARSSRSAVIAITEMLPDVPQTWLPDVAGASYSAELRLVAVDPSVQEYRPGGA